MCSSKTIERNIEIEWFIRNYLEEHHSADSLNQEFHDLFTAKFGGKQTFKMWGAMPNRLAMSWLKNLYNQGILERYTITIPDAEPGFPKWVYSYTLKGK